MRPRRLIVTAAFLIAIGVVTAFGRSQLPAIGAGALLFPARHPSSHPAPSGCADRTFEGVNALLSGWECTTPGGASKPTLVWLHGIADNRDASVGIIQRFQKRGFNLIVYDSRGHGRSGGDRCTYGYFEKRDLSLVLDQAGVDRAVLIGHSLGAAVALQTAAIDSRVVGVVAASTFADLRSVATERAPFVFSAELIDAAFELAEREGQFDVDDVSPLRAAAAIRAPVLLIHGARDASTRAEHSERVYAALRGPKQLLIVPAAGHNDVLAGEIWTRVEKWIDEALRTSLPGTMVLR